MTEEEIDKMEAGPVLDHAVAEMMGWRPDPKYKGCWIPPGRSPAVIGCYYTAKPSDYSSSIAAAWEVVEKMTTTTKQWFRFEQHSTGAQATFELSGDGDNDFECTAEAMTAPLAISRAALKASLRKAVSHAK